VFFKSFHFILILLPNNIKIILFNVCGFRFLKYILYNTTILELLRGYMKNYLSITISILALLLNSCKNSDNGNDPINNGIYPVNANFEWEYSTIVYTSYYDSSGNIDSSQTIDLGNTIVRITDINQTINGYNDLIKFISYEVSSPDNIATDWYENKTDGFYSIAYKNAGAAQPVIPKFISGKKYYNLNDVKKIFTTPGFGLFLNEATNDSIMFYEPPRKVLAYPIQIGSSWNELKIPFNRDRAITCRENISVNGVEYYAYKIESIWDMPKSEFTDYLDANSGLVMRIFSANSLAMATIDNPDGIGFVRYKSISKLVRTNF
jgi:hypothetical protein